ncbi:hypothetical protein ACFL6I_23840 [candidate division KSB1 bacterium]
MYKAISCIGCEGSNLNTQQNHFKNQISNDISHDTSYGTNVVRTYELPSEIETVCFQDGKVIFKETDFSFDVSTFEIDEPCIPTDGGILTIRLEGFGSKVKISRYEEP